MQFSDSFLLSERPQHTRLNKAVGMQLPEEYKRQHTSSDAVPGPWIVSYMYSVSAISNGILGWHGCSAGWQQVMWSAVVGTGTTAQLGAVCMIWYKTAIYAMCGCVMCTCFI